ncbi:hypothetical protein [Campylobacter concisus]|uniref:hypothetical protein n=1 Tax=Campylobacter concisus TaxID=199 RepID=UPI000CD91F9E|nr:hypothetical protein [Campylobacter concisus]
MLSPTYADKGIFILPAGKAGPVASAPAPTALPPLTPKLLSPPAARDKASMLPTLALMLLMWPPSAKLVEDKLTPSPPLPPACGPPAAVSSRALRSVPFKMACCKAEISATVSLLLES